MIYYGLLLFFVFEYVRPGNYFSPLNILHANTLLPMGVVIGSMLSKGEKPNLLGDTTTRIILFFLGMIAFSVLWAEVTMGAFTVFTTVLGYSLIYWVLARELKSIAQVRGVFGILIFVMQVLHPQVFIEALQRRIVFSDDALDAVGVDELAVG